MLDLPRDGDAPPARRDGVPPPGAAGTEPSGSPSPDVPGGPAERPGGGRVTPGPGGAAGPSGPAGDGAEREGTAGRLDDALLGGPRRWSMRDLAVRLGVGVDEVRAYWRTLGLPHADPDELLLTEADARAMERSTALVRDKGLQAATVTSLVRALGHTSDRLALWQVEALVEDLGTRLGLDDVSARLLVIDRLPEIVPLLEEQLVHSYRRQLAAIAGRYAAEFGEAAAPGDDPLALPLARGVGFADMVSFTRRTARLGPVELSEFVQRFEAATRDVVAAEGGRVVKTIGDAVLFAADDPATGARVALGLAEAFGVDPATPVDAATGAGHAGRMPKLGAVKGQPRTGAREAEGLPTAGGATPVRVGFVWGRVLSRFGDVFGPSVNLAARLTDAADPGTVLVDAPTASALAHDAELRCAPVGTRELSGLGPVDAFRLERLAG
ncbi:adenylate/guanylate cyclase domain-containing protein [Cellulomonas endophytica]|uniref:adenylate/guanylate cyclase domain-containing protein n=1 Tax=Cellulomonas endophytica TaxID=2494735 RepID=UPI001F0B9592|nr:adenylate/guanylate cyclase domain-containing protein [Cellulomonas endophytica]